MIENPPPLPSGQSPFHAWARWVQSSLLRMRITDAPGVKVLRTSKGVAIVGLGGRARGGGDGGAVQVCTITAIYGDYYDCDDENGDAIQVARPFKLRCSITTESIVSSALGGSIDVSYTAATTGAYAWQKRTMHVVSGGYNYGDQVELVVPQLVVGDKLAIGSVSDSGVDDAPDWIDLNIDSRTWAQIPLPPIP